VSEKDEILAETVEEQPKWPLPFNVGMDKLDMIVKAFRQAGADTKKVSANDLSATGLNLNSIKANIKFLSAIGILKPTEEKDSYMLVGKGVTYAMALATKDEKTSSALLKELLNDSYLKALINYIELQENLNFEQLFEHIKGMARLKEDSKYGTRGIAPPYSTGILALIDLLIRAGFVSPNIIEKKETIRPTATAKKSPAPSRKATTMIPKSEQQNGAEPGSKGAAAIIQGNVNAIPFTLNITIEAKDSESIRQLIAVIRELKGEQQQETNPT
jgi:hypothetical protein